MKCNSCGGKGVIFRPVKTLVQEIIRKIEMIDGEEIVTKEKVITETGGLDACPVCTAKAEAEYQSLMAKQTAEWRRAA